MEKLDYCWEDGGVVKDIVRCGNRYYYRLDGLETIGTGGWWAAEDQLSTRPDPVGHWVYVGNGLCHGLPQVYWRSSNEPVAVSIFGWPTTITVSDLSPLAAEGHYRTVITVTNCSTSAINTSTDLLFEARDDTGAFVDSGHTPSRLHQLTPVDLNLVPHGSLALVLDWSFADPSHVGFVDWVYLAANAPINDQAYALLTEDSVFFRLRLLDRLAMSLQGNPQ